MRRLLFITVSVLVSAGILALAVRNVPLADIGERISNVEPFWIGVCLLMVALGLWARAVRWQGLLGWRLSFARTFHASNIMFMLNFLPLRLGEVARAALAARYGVPFMTAATSVLVERLIDTVFVIIVLSFALARAPQTPELASQAAALFSIGAFVGFAVLILFARFPSGAQRLLDWGETHIPVVKRLPLRRFLNDVLVGLEPLTHWRRALHVIVWSLIAWFSSFAGYYAAQRALQIQDIDLILNALLSVSLIAFSIAIPVTIASIGPFQAAALAGGVALGMSETDALSLGVLYHVMTFIGYSSLGVIGLIALGVSLGEVTRRPPPIEAASATQTPSS
ncbi:MAG: flippase-like domain-containing protein [Anaerolineae bacterium]|nr:flippase-like domain-containing protein [Anaerolineae bacterium]